MMGSEHVLLGFRVETSNRSESSYGHYFIAEWAFEDRFNFYTFESYLDCERPKDFKLTDAVNMKSFVSMLLSRNFDG
jgi:hypothetical protein